MRKTNNSSLWLARGCALEDFYYTHQGWLRQYLRRLTLNGADADDLSQVVWLHLQQNWSEYSAQMEASGGAWLRTVAFRLFLDWRRRQEESV